VVGLERAGELRRGGRRALLGRDHLGAGRVGRGPLLPLDQRQLLGLAVSRGRLLVSLSRRGQITRGRKALALGLSRLRPRHDVAGERRRVGSGRSVARGDHRGAQLIHRAALLLGRRALLFRGLSR